MRTTAIIILGTLLTCGTLTSCSDDSPSQNDGSENTDAYVISDEEFARLNGEVIEDGIMKVESIYQDLIDDHDDLDSEDDSLLLAFARDGLDEVTVAQTRSDKENEDGEGAGTDGKPADLWRRLATRLGNHTAGVLPFHERRGGSLLQL